MVFQGISFQVGKGDGKCVGAQHKRSEFFFLRDERRSFWSWPICGFFGGNFRVLTEETFARSGLRYILVSIGSNMKERLIFHAFK